MNNSDNLNVVGIHLEPDILQCEVKLALGSNTANKVSGGDEILAKLFLILKDDTVTVQHSICQQIWITCQWPQDWKSQFSFQSQKGQRQRMFKLSYSCTVLTCYQGYAQKSSS